jgi:hypothetical protein
VTAAGVRVPGLVSGAAVTVGPAVLRGVLPPGVESGAVVRGAPGGTVIADGGPVAGGGGGVGGTGTVCDPTVVGVVRGAVVTVVVVRRRSDRSDESLPQAASTNAPTSDPATQPRTRTPEVCPARS